MVYFFYRTKRIGFLLFLILIKERESDMQGIQKHYVSEDGYNDIKKELDYRKSDLRKEIAERIKVAKEFGDLSENAAYTEAREAQNENEAKIRELEDMILTAEVVKADKGINKIQIGSKFTVELNGKENDYYLVGSSEADPVMFKISNESPLGKVFLGKSAGDEAEFHGPSGNVTKFKIKKIL